jgi:hypothetical protein
LVSTTYTLTGADNNNCKNSAILSLPALPLPNVTIVANPNPVCAGTTVTLIAAGANSYTWNNNSSSSFIIVQPIANSIFVVSGTGTNSCSKSSTLQVAVNPLPILYIASTNSLPCSGETITLSVTGAAFYSWSSGSSNSIQLYSPLTTTSFSVQGIDLNGCANSATYVQQVSPCTFIRGHSLQNFIHVYPNPNSGYIIVETGGYEAALKLEIFDNVGRLLKSLQILTSSHSVDLRDLANGHYFIALSENGYIKTVQTIVKE